MKKFLTIGFITVIIVFIAYFAFVYFVTFSEGYRSGELIKISNVQYMKYGLLYL